MRRLTDVWPMLHRLHTKHRPPNFRYVPDEKDNIRPSLKTGDCEDLAAGLVLYLRLREGFSDEEAQMALCLYKGEGQPVRHAVAIVSVVDDDGHEVSVVLDPIYQSEPFLIGHKSDEYEWQHVVEDGSMWRAQVTPSNT